MNRTAVVLFNLGGPDGPDAVQPFLFNLFNDPAIIGLPKLFRWLLAKLISSRRAPVAKAVYARIGGASPLLGQTTAQAQALQQLLVQQGSTGDDYRVFVAMRYWHPFARAVAADMRAWHPDHVVLLPLYPQYSTTTSGSSLKDWNQAATAAGLDVPTSSVCCYPVEDGWIAAQARLIEAAIDRSLAAQGQKPRLLFSAHGLPKKIVASGDPYQWQVEQTVAAIVAALGPRHAGHAICYQSRVGPLEWIGPPLLSEIERAATDKVPVVVVPVAFVSEHSETLVELDIEYREKAEQFGVPHYERVATVQTEPEFISGLAGLVRWARESTGVTSATGPRLCPGTCGRCAMAA